MPTVYIIAGPNGAGKTTFAEEFLPGFVHCREFLNADLIAAGLSPFAPETQDFKAARLFLSRLHELVTNRQNFAFETTLSGRSYIQRLYEMKSQGYYIVLFFLWLPNVEMAIKRVQARVNQGGHNVPEDIIKRRYANGLNNFFSLYKPIAQAWHLYDASLFPPRIVASTESGKTIVHDEAIFQQIANKTEG
ncbi:MAG: zeta toxin family protein [Desulfohalobiaceae bacterium]|nr:zeta toxin family protein [Desulfohalobiaceae bacterium]